MVNTQKRPLEQYEIIDFHTHIFPDPVAQKATNNVGSYYGLEMHGNGSMGNLLYGNEKYKNITHSVISSAALNPSKTRGINDFIHNCCTENRHFIGLGSFHRDTPDVLEEIDRIIALGLHGIKLHPDFQGFNIDDEKMFPIYDKLQGKLPILFHIGDQKSDCSNPKRLRRIIDKFEGLTVIAAHMGGYTTYELAKEYIFGTRAYMDTSNATRFIPKNEIVKAVRYHGSDKILFGSDFPLLYTIEAAEDLYQLDFTHDEFENIFANNAKRLLNI